MQESFSHDLPGGGQRPAEGNGARSQAIQHFIDHRVDVVRRRTAYLLARRRTASTSSKATRMRSIISTRSSPSFAAAPIARDARENLVAYFGGKKIDINITGRAPKR